MKKKKLQSRVYGGVEANLREEDRRKKLIEAGLEAFGTKGYAKTNIKTICKLAGLTERYFYESFRHKEDLLCAVYRELIDEGQRDSLAALDDSEGFPLETALRALRMFYQRFQQDPRRAQIQLFEILGVSNNIDREYQNAMRLLAEMVRLFLCKVFPHIHEEILNRSMIPTGSGRFDHHDRP
jgi:AcrR family transcriptional regulator